MEFLKWGQKQVRQFALNLTETEMLVEEATNNDPWGPHGSVMSKIADEAADSEKYREVMTVIARRLTDSGENWRHVYKALLLLEHLVRHGPTRVARDTQANSNVLLELQSFEFKDKNGRDQGVNVRNRSKELLSLVSDSEKLAEAREVARANRDKFRGASKENARFVSSSSPAVFNQSFPKRVVYEEKKEERDEEEEEDPFEATRKRIEKLKGKEKDTASTIQVNLPQQPKKEPKKLSQVKMNPEIAATFLKQQSAAVPAAKVSSTQTQTQTRIPDDLLGDLTHDPPSTVAAEPTVSMEEMKKGIDDVFDPFAEAVPISEPLPAAPPVTSAEASVPAGKTDWADFHDAQPPQVPKEIPLTELLTQDGGLNMPVMPTAAAAPNVVTAPGSRADPFASLCLTGQKTIQVPMGAGKTATGNPATHAAPIPPGHVSSRSVVDTPTPWTMPAASQQPSAKPRMDFQTNVMFSAGMGSTGLMRLPGAPMNPAAASTQRPAIRKEDPFANLGF